MTGMRNTIFLLLAAAAPPVPPPELLQLKPFLATLSCSGQVEESPLGPARSSQGTMTGKRDRPGFWVQIRYEEKRGAKHPLATSSEERWSYDPGQKRFIALLWDSFGGYGSGASPGWEGDSLVWTGEVTMNGQKVPYRQTFTREKDGSLDETWEMQINGAWNQGVNRDVRGGAWTRLTSGTCKPRD